MSPVTKKPKGGGAVMSSRVLPSGSLEYFPTPPWGTRALMEHVLQPTDYPGIFPHLNVWEPAAGEGHMADVLAEYFLGVYASDVHDYGSGYDVGSFIGGGLSLDRAECPFRPHWIITNPPFEAAQAFLERAIAEASEGVALLLRSNWAESIGRYEAIFRDRPPSIEALFVERLPMHEGGWDPDGDTMTSYSWFIWRASFRGGETRKMWIPPGRRRALERPDDRRRFANPRNAEGEFLPLAAIPSEKGGSSCLPF